MIEIDPLLAAVPASSQPTEHDRHAIQIRPSHQTLLFIQRFPDNQNILDDGRFQNIATRNRGSGYIDEAIPVLQELTKDGAGPSYVYVVLSDFYAMRGDSVWLKDYLTTARKAASVLSAESPASSWYGHTIRDLLKMAKRTGRTADVTEFYQSSEATSEPAPSTASSASQS